MLMNCYRNERLAESLSRDDKYQPKNPVLMKAVPTEIRWNPDLSVFASEPFLKATGDEYGWLGGHDDAGRLRCVLPYTIVRKAIFRMIRLRVETIPLVDDLEVQEEKEFLNEAVRYFRSVGAHMIIPATTNTIFRTYPDGGLAAPYGTYIIDLTQPEKVLFGNLNTSHRRKVRLAVKNGVEIQGGLEHVKTAYELVRDTFKRSNLGFMDYKSFQRYVAGLEENVQIFVAVCEDTVQGAVVIPFSNHTAYYVYGGSMPEIAPGAMNLLHWEAIRRFREMGVRQYDFVGSRVDPEKGSKQEGLAIFKQRFGGKFVQGYMWKYPLSRISYGVYALAVRTLRGGDIVDQERHKMNELQLTGSHELDNRKIG
jgi:hypothetical protein